MTSPGSGAGTTRVTAGSWCTAGPAGVTEVTGPVAVGIADGRITAVETVAAVDLDPGATDLVLVPGFVDLQVNGVGAVDFATADPAAWADALAAQLRTGTTSCCPTFVTASLDAYAPWLERLGHARDGAAAAPGTRASILGAHLEGPFLGGAPGTHPGGLIRTAGPRDVDWLRALLEAAPRRVQVMTIAPEADPDGALTALLLEHGVTVAIGHSSSAYEVAVSAADRGARLVTHLFNAMSPLHHRAPGVAGAALDDDRLTPSLIADLVHVHPVALRAAIARKRNVALVTDAVAADAGTVGGVTLREQDGAARLADGTLAGSVLTMAQAVRNVVGLGVPLARAVEMAATVPCEVLGLTDRGRLAVGARADLVALDRETLAVRAVWHAGIRVTFPPPPGGRGRGMGR